jgi:hypothetical protein
VLQVQSLMILLILRSAQLPSFSAL